MLLPQAQPSVLQCRKIDRSLHFFFAVCKGRETVICTDVPKRSLRLPVSGCFFIRLVPSISWDTVYCMFHSRSIIFHIWFISCASLLSLFFFYERDARVHQWIIISPLTWSPVSWGLITLCPRVLGIISRLQKPNITGVWLFLPSFNVRFSESPIASKWWGPQKTGWT